MNNSIHSARLHPAPGNALRFGKLTDMQKLQDKNVGQNLPDLYNWFVNAQNRTEKAAANELLIATLEAGRTTRELNLLSEKMDEHKAPVAPDLWRAYLVAKSKASKADQADSIRH